LIKYTSVQKIYSSDEQVHRMSHKIELLGVGQFSAGKVGQFSAGIIS